MQEKDPGQRLFTTASEHETRELGRRLSALLRPGDVVLLVGELGAGKTCLAQGVARGLGVGERVTSPTFTLLREYRGRMPLYHLDAYRLEGPWDLFELGMEEYLESEGVLLVEWGDRAGDFFGPDTLEVEICFGEAEDERVVRFKAASDDWANRLRHLDSGGGGVERA